MCGGDGDGGGGDGDDGGGDGDDGGMVMVEAMVEAMVVMWR